MNNDNIDYKQKYEKLLKEYEKKEKRLEKILSQSDAQAKKLLELNEKLEEMSNTDPMTGAFNRRYFYNTAKHMVSLAKRENYDSSVVILDIDKFKNINDTYGHDVGDVIIKHLANEIGQNVRDSDIFARFGGEEFVIFLNDMDIQNGILFCERIRQMIQDSNPIDDIKYTVSIGISSILHNDESVDIALKRADLALYEAKETGRNKVIEYKE